MQLHFKEYGHGAPIVILHGLFGSSDNWNGIAQKLAERFHVFSLDLRNHGRSPHSAKMDLPLMAEDVAEFLSAKHLTDAVILGHSLGGKVAMRLALSHPAKLRALIIVDMAPRAYAPAHTAIFEAMLRLDLKAFQTRSQIEAALSPAIHDDDTRRFLLKNVGNTEDGGFKWKLNLRGIHDNYSHLNEAVAVGVDETFAKPALFVRGNCSDYVTDTDSSEIQKLFPVARLATIPNAGHWVHADAPDAFLARVHDFLADHLKS